MKKFIVFGLLGIMFGVCSAPALSFDVYLTRHFEKQSSAANPDLTEQGKKRAQALVKLLQDKSLAVIYSTDYQRTKQTALPLAEAMDKTLTLYDPSNMRSFIQKVKSAEQSVLIVGHSNTTPIAIKLLGGEAKVISESDYGELFKVSIKESETETSSQIVNID